MRILLVNRFFGDPHTPTARMLADLAQALAQAGHTVQVLTTRGAYAGMSDTRPGEGHLELRYLPVWHRGPRLLTWLLFWLQVLCVLPWLRWDRCVVLTDPPFLATAAWLAQLLGGRWHRKTYLWSMDLYPEALVASRKLRRTSLLYRLLHRLNDISLGALDGLICLGHCQRRHFEHYRSWSRLQRHCLIVPPWDDRALARVERTQNRFLAKYGLAGKRVVLYAGNLGEAHSVTEIVCVARHFDKLQNSDWMFVFVVRGAKRRDLEAETAGLANVAVLDYQPPELTADLLWAADIHLITMAEGWQGVVVPSKLYGVLHTDAPVLFIGPAEAGTADELQRYEAGATVPTGAPPELIAAKLNELYADYPRQRRPSVQAAAQQIARFVGA